MLTQLDFRHYFVGAIYQWRWVPIIVRMLMHASLHHVLALMSATVARSAAVHAGVLAELCPHPPASTLDCHVVCLLQGAMQRAVADFCVQYVGAAPGIAT